MSYGAVGEMIARYLQQGKKKKRKIEKVFTAPTAKELMNDPEYRE